MEFEFEKNETISREDKIKKALKGMT